MVRPPRIQPDRTFITLPAQACFHTCYAQYPLLPAQMLPPAGSPPGSSAGGVCPPLGRPIAPPLSVSGVGLLFPWFPSWAMFIYVPSCLCGRRGLGMDLIHGPQMLGDGSSASLSSNRAMTGNSCSLIRLSFN